MTKQTRFAALRTALASASIALLSAGAAAGTLDHVKETGKLTLGYRTDSSPFTTRDENGKPAGYAIAICEQVASDLKSFLGVSDLPIAWTSVTADGQLAAVRDGTIDLLCAPDDVTLAKRKQVSYSIPVFPGGGAALLRADAPERLQHALEERPPPYQPLWRGSAPQVYDRKTFSAVAGSPAAAMLATRIAQFKVTATIAPVKDVEEGISKVLAGSTDVLFADRAMLLEAWTHNASAADLKVLSRHYTFESAALALKRDDDDFRYAVDRALSRLYASPDFGAIYEKAFGKPDPDTVAFFRSTVVPN